MVKQMSMALIGIAALSQARAQDSTAKAAADSAKPASSPAPIITGSVDAYYRFNFNAPNGKTNNYTSFTNSQSSFELGMASVRADHSFGKVSATVDLGFGRRAEEFSYNDASHPSLFAVKQAYVSYQATPKIKFTMGKWATHVGYEVLDAYANRNYSMDYMFSYGPFFHTGLKMDVAPSSNFGFMVGIANPNDFSTTSAGVKTALAQLSASTTNAKWKFYLNYWGYYGVHENTSFWKNTSQIDLVVTGAITSQFGIGFNGTYQTVKAFDDNNYNWWGSALYLNLDPSPVLGLTLRGEYFHDKDGIKLVPIDNADDDGHGGIGNVFDVTLTGQIHLTSNLTLMPEIRLDAAKKDFFYKGKDETPTKNTVSALVAVAYHF